MVDQTRCSLCGRFMDDDDVLLGHQSDDGNYQHANCVKKVAEKGCHEWRDGDLIAKDFDPEIEPDA